MIFVLDLFLNVFIFLKKLVSVSFDRVIELVFRAQASLQSGLRKWPSWSGGPWWWRRARKKLHPPEPSACHCCSRRHCGYVRGQHVEFHCLPRVPQCTALRQHGAGQAEAGNQQVGFLNLWISFSHLLLVSSSWVSPLRLTPGCWRSCCRRRESIKPSCNKSWRKESKRSDCWRSDLSPQVCMLFIKLPFTLWKPTAISDLMMTSSWFSVPGKHSSRRTPSWGFTRAKTWKLGWKSFPFYDLNVQISFFLLHFTVQLGTLCACILSSSSDGNVVLWDQWFVFYKDNL